MTRIPIMGMRCKQLIPDLGTEVKVRCAEAVPDLEDPEPILILSGLAGEDKAMAGFLFGD
jgi:hypothetical protein